MRFSRRRRSMPLKFLAGRCRSGSPGAGPLPADAVQELPYNAYGDWKRCKKPSSPLASLLLASFSERSSNRLKRSCGLFLPIKSQGPVMRRSPPITTSERHSEARPAGQKLAVVMVGLPARGKTFVARKLQGYLSWLGYHTLWVNVGDYRRSRAGARQPATYFAPDNSATREEREGFATAALNDLLDWFNKGGEVGIYDATNAERPRRDLIRQQCSAAGVD